MLPFDERIEKNYDVIRQAFEEDLVENWYQPHLVSEVDDGREEFKQREYNIYLENIPQDILWNFYMDMSDEIYWNNIHDSISKVK